MELIFALLASSFTDNYFVLFISLSYMLISLIVKSIVHGLINYRNDLWIVFAWTSIDISMITLAVCIGSNIPKHRGLSYNETAFWYLGLAFCVVMAALFYGLYVKLKNNDRDRTLFRLFKLGLYMTLNWLFGFAFFVPTLNGLNALGK